MSDERDWVAMNDPVLSILQDLIAELRANAEGHPGNWLDCVDEQRALADRAEQRLTALVRHTDTNTGRKPPVSAIPVLDNLTPDDVQRFWSKVDKPYAAMDCWLWTDGLDKEGYARMWLWGHKAAAHRIAWALHHGEDPAPGLVIDHTCGTRMCVNPDHLEAVTQQENLKRAHIHQPCVAGHDAKHRTNGRCAQCYRERADRIRRAAKMLGITQTEYKQRYGWRRDTLENVLTTGQPQP